ncbi:MAG: nitroreductase family protein [Bacteroidales bacterium]|nr:nitroreductase family protein [Bacteroidales bacterium]
MADNYLEKRYEEVFGQGRRQVKRIGHTVDELLRKNRSCRGYKKSFTVTREMLERIVGVNTKIPSGCNRQVLRFKLVTKDTGAEKVLANIKMGAALPELHLPFPGTEPEAFIIVCCEGQETKLVDIDLGISLQSMLLKAVEMGLSGLIIGAFNKAALTEAFQLPHDPIAVLCIGKGAERIELTPIAATESHAYYRKETSQGMTHFVPKVRLEDLILP